MVYSYSMIEVRIREAAEKRKLKTPAALSRSVGVSKPTAARLWDGESLKRVDIETLDSICTAWRCDLRELIRYVPNGAGKKKR